MNPHKRGEGTRAADFRPNRGDLRGTGPPARRPRADSSDRLREGTGGRAGGVGSLGIAGDEHIYHAHGGPDQALLAYSRDHYPFWRDEHGLDLPAAGAFAENLTVAGLTETEVCIDDTFRAGGAVLQITSPRSPCYKIGVRYGRRDLPVVMQDALNPGYLLRVAVPGTIARDDTMDLIDRQPETVTVAEAARVVSRDDWPALERLLAVPGLAAAMRETLLARLERHDRGNEDARLFGEGEGEPLPTWSPTPPGTPVRRRGR